MSVLKRILHEAWKKKTTVLFLLLLMLLAAGLDLVAPFIAKDLIDRLVNSFAEKQPLALSVIFLAGAGIFAATVISRLLDTMYDYRLFKFVTRLEDELRFQAYQKYLSLHVLYHHEISSGHAISRIDRGASGVYSILRDIIGKFVVQPTFIVVLITGVLFYLDPLIAALVILPLPLFLAVVVPLAGKIYRTEKKATKLFEKYDREEHDVAANVITVKHFGQESRETVNQRGIRDEARKLEYESERYWKLSEVLQTTVATIGRVGVIVAGGYFTLIGRVSVGEFVLFVTLQNMVYQPLWQLSILFAIFRRQLAKAERLFKILDAEPKVVDRQGAFILPSFEHEIVFDHVSFSFRNERQVIRDISVAIPAGKMIALVGRSGSGKSTFVNLLLRSFDPTEGSIKIDGHDLRDVTQRSLRDQIAIVSQEVNLFSRTIEENIAYGKPDATKKDIQKAAELAYAHDFILNTPDQYQTMVGERGVKLSGGERQRVGIARAILRDPRILILDEATSHLDTESERIVQKALEHLTAGKTTIVIAHRLSTVLHADQILVFDQGQIIDAGKHAELLERSEVYKRLYQLQFEE